MVLLTPAAAGAGTLSLLDEPKPGEIVTVAGTGDSGESGDGGPAAEATIPGELDIAAGDNGRLYIADTNTGRIRIVDDQGGIDTITEPDDSADQVAIAARGGDLYIAGTSAVRRISDGSTKTLAELTDVLPVAAAVDGKGAVYLADREHHRILQVTSGTVRTIAGNGDVDVDSAEGRSATDTWLSDVAGLAADSAGNVYFTEGDSVVYRIDTDGVLQRFAGSEPGFAGDGGKATEARLADPVQDIAVDDNDNVHIADRQNLVVRVVNDSGEINSVPFPVTTSGSPFHRGMAAGDDGKIYVNIGSRILMRTTDEPSYVVQDEGSVAPSPVTGADPGTVRTVAEGRQQAGGSTFDGPSLGEPTRLSVGRDGTVSYLDASSHAMQRIDRHGAINAFPEFRAVIDSAPGPDGSVFVAGDHPEAGMGVHRVDADGSVVRIAGGGSLPPQPDESPEPPATATDLPISRIVVGQDGKLYIAGGSDIWRLTAEGTLQHAAPLPPGAANSDLAVDRTGTIYVADKTQHRIVKIDSNGEETTVAGDGRDSYRNDDNGDGGKATDAAVIAPDDIAVDDDGRLYVVGGGDIRRVDTDGVIDTIYSAPDGDADARVGSIAVDAHGDLYFSQPQRQRVSVLAAPGEITEPFPWLTAIGIGAGAIVIVLAGGRVIHRRRRRG